IAAETLNAVPVSKREDAADHGHGDDRYAQQSIGQRGEVDVQQYANQQDRQRHNHPQAFDCILKIAKFADPFQAIARRQRAFLGNPALCLEHRAAEVAPANAEFDWNIALLLLAIDERRAGHQIDLRDLAQRYLRDFIGNRILHRNGQTADGLDVLPIFGRQSNDEREVPVASFLVEVACRPAADGGLNRRIDVAGRQPIARGCLPIDIDAKRRLPQRREYRKVGDAADFAHRLFDLLRSLSQHNHVIADQLHRVLAFDAGYSFLDVVLDVLREVEVHARKLRLQSRVDLLDELVLGHTLAPLLGRLQRGKELGIEEARRIGAVIGSSLLGHDGLDFGKFLITNRMRLTKSLPSSSEIEGGMVARIQRL